MSESLMCKHTQSEQFREFAGAASRPAFLTASIFVILVRKAKNENRNIILFSDLRPNELCATVGLCTFNGTCTKNRRPAQKIRLQERQTLFTESRTSERKGPG